MKYFEFLLFIITVVLVEGNHTFFGTNVQRPLVHHKLIEYSSNFFQKRVEFFYYTLPNDPVSGPRTIQGVMAYDKTNSEASANVTQGGLGYNFINIRMKSERGKKLEYDIYIYA